MEIKAYNTEKFERNKWRYILFATIFIAIIVLSLAYKNIVGTVLLFFLLWWYFYYEIINSKIINIRITKEWLIIGQKIVSRHNLSGYAIEMETKTQKIKNIVFITNNGHMIHTMQDSLENIESFVNALSENIPMMSEYRQSFIEKASRKLKL